MNIEEDKDPQDEKPSPSGANDAGKEKKEAAGSENEPYDTYPTEEGGMVPAPEPATDSSQDADSREAEAPDEDAPQSDPNDSERRMPFLDHLEELRWTIIRSVLATVICAIGAYVFSEDIVAILHKPAPDIKLVFLSPTEAFMTYIKVALWSGLIIALPYVAWEFWRFVVPGLLAKEKKIVPPIVFFTVLCFMIGALFAYFIIIPFGLKFLITGFQSDYLEPFITIGKYLGFVITMILVFGLVFELPVLAYFLSSIGLLTPTFLREKRRYGIVIIFIVAAIITPPDAFTQSMLALPLIILYEISIWVSAGVYKRRMRKQARSS